MAEILESVSVIYQTLWIQRSGFFLSAVHGNNVAGSLKIGCMFVSMSRLILQIVVNSDKGCITVEICQVQAKKKKLRQKEFKRHYSEINCIVNNFNVHFIKGREHSIRLSKIKFYTQFCESLKI